MIVILVLAGDDATAALLGQIADVAGYRAIAVREDEVLRAVERMRPSALLVAAELALDAALVPAARRAGVRVVYFSASLSAYDVADFARRRGLPHFPLLSGPAGLRRAVEGEALAAAPAPRDLARSAPLARRATEVAQESRRLALRSREAIAAARELRAAHAVRVAAGRASRETLRDSVVSWTIALRRDGAPLERVLDLMRTAVAEGVAERAAPAPAEAGVEEAMRWAEDAYRVA